MADEKYIAAIRDYVAALQQREQEYDDLPTPFVPGVTAGGTHMKAKEFGKRFGVPADRVYKDIENLYFNKELGEAVMTHDTDRIRDMVMALSRGDHEEAQTAANDVMAAKTARLTSSEELTERMNPMRQRRNAMGNKGRAARTMARGERGMRGRGRVNEEGDDEDDLRDSKKKYRLGVYPSEEIAPEWDEPGANDGWSIDNDVDRDENLDPEYVKHVRALGKVLRKDSRNSPEWEDKSMKMAKFLAKKYGIPPDHAWRNLDNAYYGRPLWAIYGSKSKKDVPDERPNREFDADARTDPSDGENAYLRSD